MFFDRPEQPNLEDCRRKSVFAKRTHLGNRIKANVGNINGVFQAAKNRPNRTQIEPNPGKSDQIRP
jgi:hypothetical protein